MAAELATGLTAPVLASIADMLKHPAYPSAMWNLVPTKSGLTPVAEGRGGPLRISWEIHGSGPIKIVLIMGLGAFKSAWQRQTLHFGHERGDRYSVLILDNRGMGLSDRPLMRFSTSEMARDLLEVADHVGWTADRELHLCGVSMGGMIAQEAACTAPRRVASLTLCCTAAAIRNTTTFAENIKDRVTWLVPRGLEASVHNAARRMFPRDWLFAPDDAHLPSPVDTPGVGPPLGGGGDYGRFGTNYERFVAQEMHKRLDRDHFTTSGFLLQLIAAGWHHKGREQLAEMADIVGRDRITVIHGTADKMITLPHGETLIEFLQPGAAHIVPGMGHAPVVERCGWFNSLLEDRIQMAEKLNGG